MDRGNDRRCVFAPATPADADELAAAMREADRREVALMHGFSPLSAARLSVEFSEVAFSARVDGRLHCLFGALRDSLIDSTAAAWMLCTDEPVRNPRTFVAHCREGLRLLSSSMPDVELFTNFVHAENAAAIRWLVWAGAWFAPASEGRRGLFGGEFRRFSIDALEAGKESTNV